MQQSIVSLYGKMTRMLPIKDATQLLNDNVDLDDDEVNI